jgi:hypothetical protein
VSKGYKLTKNDEIRLRVLLRHLLEEKLGDWEPLLELERDWCELDSIKGQYDDYTFERKNYVIQSAICICVSLSKHGDLRIPPCDEGIYFVYHSLLYNSKADSAKNVNSIENIRNKYTGEFWKNLEVVAWLICEVWRWYYPLTCSHGIYEWINDSAKIDYEAQRRYDND